MEKITIAQIGRKQNPSKYKPGETYTITTIVDTLNRTMSAVGKWSETWQVGQTIDAEIKTDKYVGNDGLERVSLKLVDPNKKEWKGSGSNSWHKAYELAVLWVLGTQEGLKTLSDVDNIAKQIKLKLDNPPASGANPAPQTMAGLLTPVAYPTPDYGPVDEPPF